MIRNPLSTLSKNVTSTKHEETERSIVYPMKLGKLQLPTAIIISLIIGIVIGGYLIPSQMGSQFGGYQVISGITARTGPPIGLLGCPCGVAVTPSGGTRFMGAPGGSPQTASVTVTVNFNAGNPPSENACVNCKAGPVTLSVSGLPRGVTATFSVNSQVPTFSSTLTFSTVGQQNVQFGADQQVTITASGEGGQCSTTYLVTVDRPPQ